MALLLLLLPVLASGHGYLARPASRNLLKSRAGQEVCPHCLQSGGPENVKARGNDTWPSRGVPGSHGLCGDPVQGRKNPASFAEEAYIVSGEAQESFVAGQVVEFRVSVTAHHHGHYEFRLCEKPLDALHFAMPGEAQKCLDGWLLKRAQLKEGCGPGKGDTDCQPLDERHPERWYLPPATLTQRQLEEGATEVHIMRYHIPDDFACERCTLQWYWATGNSCLADVDYFEYFQKMKALGWRAELWAPRIFEKWATKENSVCGKKASGRFPEEFWNCADISVERVPAARGKSLMQVKSAVSKRVLPQDLDEEVDSWEALESKVEGARGKSLMQVTSAVTKRRLLPSDLDEDVDSWEALEQKLESEL